MGWNAGGFGSMSFPDVASLAAWKKSKVVHSHYDDWPPELACTIDPDETVAKRLARIAKRDDPLVDGIHDIPIQDHYVWLAYDIDGLAFHAAGGGMAALMRSAAPYGAEGTFWFLGTAGAEELFAHELVLSGGESTLRTLKGPAIRKLYASSEYQDFAEYTFDRFESEPEGAASNA